ncbi:hypothetical protein GQ607_007040 [Colletotrichum asianum]|uniref:Uncharacterized protein n=1 Tax=Colletotrichum asianum TaxID=702518 RepID=A0A8H3ZN92_9PEZI|nr:hypothetical protein GQ607_007040 [Colletotrichum asianum]
MDKVVLGTRGKARKGDRKSALSRHRCRRRRSRCGRKRLSGPADQTGPVFALLLATTMAIRTRARIQAREVDKGRECAREKENERGRLR